MFPHTAANERNLKHFLNEKKIIEDYECQSAIKRIMCDCTGACEECEKRYEVFNNMHRVHACVDFPFSFYSVECLYRVRNCKKSNQNTLRQTGQLRRRSNHRSRHSL